MQIHELNKRKLSEAIVGPGGIVDRIKTTAQTLAKPGAGKALAQSTPKDTSGFVHSTWMDMYRQTQADRATQTWIDGLLKQWKMQVGNLPVPQAKSKDLKEAVDLTPDQIAQQFQSWTDQYLNTKTITMDQVRATDSGPRLEGLLDKVARAQAAGAQQAFDQAFRDYMNVAAAGIRVLTQQHNQKNPQAQTNQTQPHTTAPGAMDIRQQLQTVGISNQQLLKLGQLVATANNGEVRSTGNPAVDDVLRNMGFRI